jgi:hypothetical protein
LDVDDDEPEPDTDDEFEDLNPSQPSPLVLFTDFETYRLVYLGDDLTRVEDSENLGEWDSDQEYD